MAAAASLPMQAALAAAAAVRGSTSPNPWVGAAIVRGRRVLATGATEPPGSRHAEAVVLAAAPPEGADILYVTLEPCMPFPGKRTPPCVEAIVASGIRHVVIALLDPDPSVGGRGVGWLRERGVFVEVGDGAEPARALLRPYLKQRQTGLPYVIAKFAASLDGQVATRTGDSQWITATAARDRGHEQRAWVDAVLVGSGTVLADDPALTARPGGVMAVHQPVRIVVDGRGRIAPRGKLFTTAGGPVIVATTAASSAAWRQALQGAGAQIIECEPGAAGGVNLDQLLRVLAGRGILSIWAEGGGTLLGSLLGGGHVDEVWAFVAPLLIGGGARPAVGGVGVASLADAWRLRAVQVELLEGDVLVRGYVGDWEPG